MNDWHTFYHAFMHGSEYNRFFSNYFHNGPDIQLCKNRMKAIFEFLLNNNTKDIRCPVIKIGICIQQGTAMKHIFLII
jgi:hypothetical protein